MKKQLTLISILAASIFSLLILVMSSPEPEGRQDAHFGYRKVEHSLNIELKWMDQLADQGRFELVQDTLQHHLGRMEAFVSRQRSELNYCCEDESLRLEHWGGGAYSLNVKLLFPTESSRNSAIDELLQQGFAQLDLKSLNAWEAKGNASLSLPIPNQNGGFLEIKAAEIKLSAHREMANLFG
jgi:hypothetical protein